MAIILNDNIRANIAKPLEDKRMNNGVPYTSVAQANSLLNPVVDRYESLEVVIGTPSNWSIYWYKNGKADTDLILKEEGGAGLGVWDNTKSYSKDDAVLYEDPVGYYTLYVAKQSSTGAVPPTSTGDWGVVNDGAFVPINGNASIKDTKTFEKVQVEDNLNFTGIESGIGIHYIVDGVNNILRLNKFPSGDPLDINNDIIRYFSALEEMAIRWKLKLESVALGDDNDEVLLIGTNGEVKKIAFSDISVETTDIPAQDSTQPFNAGGAYLLDEAKVDRAGDTMTGDLIIQGDLDVENIEINGGQIDNLANATQPQQAATKNQLDSEIASVRADISSVYRAAGDVDASLGTFPTTGTGLGGAVRRGDTYNVTVAGTIAGFEPLDVGDTFYANVNNPAQTASNWRKFEANTAQATESFRGTTKIATQTVIENESTLNDTDSVTPSKFWLGWNRIKQLASTFAAKITFTTAPRFSSTTANQYLRVDGSKDLTSVSAIPAADVTETTTRRFVSDTEKTTWNGKLSTDFSNITGVPTNTGNAYSVTVPATIPSPPLNGQPILFMPQSANTGAATLAVNGGTAYPINKGVTTALQTGDLQAGKDYMLHFNTANNSWQILGELRNDNILNQTTALQTGGFWTGTGRLDTGLGLGLAPNSAAFETVAAATSAKAQFLITQGTVDTTLTINGLFWNNAGELKFIDNSIVNRVLKIYNNELLKSSGNYSLSVNQFGDISATNKEIEAYIYNSTAISEITNNTGWTDARKTITAGLVFQGQWYYSSTTKYFYQCVDDDVVVRMVIRNNRSCTKTITIASTGSSFQDNDFIGASNVHFLIVGGNILQDGMGMYSFNSSTGTITLDVSAGDVITVTYT